MHAELVRNGIDSRGITADDRVDLLSRIYIGPQATVSEAHTVDARRIESIRDGALQCKENTVAPPN